MHSIVARALPTVKPASTSGGPAGCIFCEIVAGSRQAHLVLDQPGFLAFLDNRPLFPGHVLVVPRRHAANIADLTEPLLGGLLVAGRRVAQAQRRALGADGNLFALNDVVSQSVPHSHLHVVPRRKGDGLRGFFWPRSRYGDEEEAASLADRIRQAMDRTDPVVSREGEVLIRLARVDDVGRLADLLSAGSLRGQEDPRDLAPYRDAFEEISATPGSEILVAEVAGEVAGMCQLIMFRHIQERGGRTAEIESVHVDERVRNSGIGSALVLAAVDRGRQAGCYRVQLTSNKVRADAHRFYERLGFTATHEGFKIYF